MSAQEYKELTTALKESGMPLDIRKKLQFFVDTEYIGEAEKVGVKECINCGGDTLVCNSRVDQYGRIVRKRTCTSCKQFYNTIEVLEPIEAAYLERE